MPDEEQQETEQQESAPEERYVDPNSGSAPQPGGHAAGQVPVPEPSDEEPMDPTGPSFGSGQEGAEYGALEHSAAGPKSGDEGQGGEGGGEGDEGDGGDPEVNPESDAEGDQYDEMSYDELKDEVRDSDAEDKPALNSSAEVLREWLRAND